MTGEGIVRPEAGAAAIEASLAEVAAPMLARRVAVLADRLDRLATHDEVATARRVREAGAADGGEAKCKELDALVASLADEPAAAVRKLRRTAEGVDRLLGLWDDLARDLGAGRAWTEGHRDRASALLGRRPGDIGLSRFEALSAATEAEGRAAALAERVAAEVAALRAHREALPAVDVARERREAAGMALFDASAQGALFRRYEMATERNFHKALAEVRKAGALGLADAALAGTAVATDVLPQRPRPPLASSGEAPPAGPPEPPPPRPVPPAPAPDPVTSNLKPSPTLSSGALIVPTALPAAWEQNEAFGKKLLNFLDPAELAAANVRTGRRPRLPRR